MFPSKLYDLSPERTIRDFSTTFSEQDLDCEFYTKIKPAMKKSQSNPRSYIKQDLIDESNIEGDLIIRECNRFIQEPVTMDIFQKIALNSRCSGYLKFFDESKNYGFIVMDSDHTDIFVYADDLIKTGVQREYLRTAKYGNMIRFTFQCQDYVGKYNKSRKAIDLEYVKPTTFFY